MKSGGRACLSVQAPHFALLARSVRGSLAMVNAQEQARGDQRR